MFVKNKQSNKNKDKISKNMWKLQGNSLTIQHIPPYNKTRNVGLCCFWKMIKSDGNTKKGKIWGRSGARITAATENEEKNVKI